MRWYKFTIGKYKLSRMRISDFSIEQVINEDLYSLSELDKEVFGEDAFSVYILKEYLDDNLMFKKIIDKNSGQIAGFFIVTELNDSENPELYDRLKMDKRDKIAYLDNIVLRKEYWNKGLGKYMMDWILKRLINGMFKFITLEVNEENSRAIDFYKKLRFDIVGIKREYYKSRKNALSMIHKL